SSPAKVQEKPCRKGPYALRNEGQGKEAFMDMDLRSSTRVAVTYPVRLSGDSMIGQGTLINLSGPGCAVETTLPVQPGDYLELHVMAPDQARPLTVGLAKVRWATEKKAGIEFIRVRRDEQSRLQRLIGQVLEESTMEASTNGHELTAA
ncbi:MAG: PilZ domain-containing protein, partial [Nitrospira sp.]|nr:PilZ domain-containing protein [Nitrospira sp.]